MKTHMNITGKKVLIIVENLPLPFDRRVWQEANTLKDNGAEVFIICPKGKGYESSYENIHGIHIYRHKLPVEGNSVFGYFAEYFSALFWELLLAIKIFIKHRFDVIQACNPPDLIFLVALPFKLFGVKFVFDHHDINPELYIAKKGKQDFFYKLMLFLEKLTFRLADISIATNHSYKEIAIARGKMAPEDVFVVRSGPKLERLKIQPPQPELKYGKSILIGYVGVIGQQEGIDHLLEVLSILVNEHRYTDFHCTICGGGPALEAMQQYAAELNLQNFVNFTGRIPDEELLPILNTADICVNSDVWNEMNDKSTMNKVMEYMALGKPMVQYDLKEGRFSASLASLYAKANDRQDFAQKLLELINDPAKRAEMGEFGRNRVESQLQWEIEAPKLIRAYSWLWADGITLLDTILEGGFFEEWRDRKTPENGTASDSRKRLYETLSHMD